MFDRHVVGYAHWCKWTPAESRTLVHAEDIASTLQVWDDLWADMFVELGDDTWFAEWVWAEMRKILEFATATPGVGIITHVDIDY